MKRKSQRIQKKGKTKMKGSLARHITVQLGQVALMPLQQQQDSSPFQNLLDTDSDKQHFPSTSSLDFDAADANITDEKDFILSQDFFCTPDYITPDAPAVLSSLDCKNEEPVPCPKSPEKIKTVRSKRQRRADGISETSFNFGISALQEMSELVVDNSTSNEIQTAKPHEPGEIQRYVSQSAVALRCRVMPPPCIKNPYLKDASILEIDPFNNQRSKCADLFPGVIGGDGLSRYRTDFQEIEKIGDGNFSCVFKAVKRIDGCMYAVKCSTRQLHKDAERRKALMEVQALAALGSHENIVGYYSCWFEDEKLYIQMELCDHSLSLNKFSNLITEAEVLEAMHQIAKALQFIHERGIAHLDVKPDNVYVKNGIYKLGDFGCATLLDRSLPIEEGDARYMPQEILNDNYDCLEKVDIFALGITMYELVRGSALPQSGTQFSNLKEGKVPLLPGHSLQFQNLLKVMMDPEPTRRPSAKELLENPIFNRVRKAAKDK
ncbi:unnamed protein product [Coffea canephora]|uniref:Wee1-like protein kinase n=2 Tax=Coffea TaxID=13442 RepID=A0A068U4M9_COFCA|nr:wee1-like protein kinase isoform X1 [Coffea arabica]CDP03520.1 unnamed protein product [Coffea canephora]